MYLFENTNLFGLETIDLTAYSIAVGVFFAFFAYWFLQNIVGKLVRRIAKRAIGEENAKTLRTDENGVTWMFSGDMGYMDEEGFIYFKQRIKRMIVTSGYNVYPTHIENILDKHEAVDYCCVIGVKDDYRVQKIRAYIVLKAGFEASEETKKSILDHCKLYLDAYEKPREIIFKDELPKTLVGKVAYHALEEEAEKELANA